jgi:hypothetical protein
MMATRSDTPRLSERDFQAQIIQLARMSGWLCYHTHDSRRSEPGWPDLTMVQPGCDDRPGRIIFVELKTDTGRVTPAQRTWLEALARCPNVEVHVWRPSQWDEIVSRLKYVG